MRPSPPGKLSDIGEEIKKSIEYAIMPNHIHMIILDNNKGGSGTPPLRSVVGRIKSFTTKQYGVVLWQRSYYDHIIRDERDYIEKREYIRTNPVRWAEDEYY